jgi:hypothetical protein
MSAIRGFRTNRPMYFLLEPRPPREKLAGR